MPETIVTAGSDAVDLLAESRSVEVCAAQAAIRVLAATPAVETNADAKALDPCVCDDIISGTWSTPTLTSISIEVLDIDATLSSATVRFVITNFITGGSACKAYWKCSSELDPTVYAQGKNKGIETHTQPDTSDDLLPLEVIDNANRDCAYDVWWRWTSGIESSEWAYCGQVLVAPEGFGDMPAVALP